VKLRRIAFISLVGFSLSGVIGNTPVQGAFHIGNLLIGGYLKNESSWHLQRPGELMKSQWQFNLELDYHLSDHITCFLQLRPEYEAIFKWSSHGMGAHDEWKDELQDNWFRNDDFNPLVREAWIHINYENFEARLGRQIVVWGRSDGIRLLDMVNPYFMREGVLDEDEDAKIPIWMFKLRYWFTVENGLELLWIPRYVPSVAPLKDSPFAFQATKMLEGELIPMLKSFGIKFKHSEPGTSISKSEIGLRWLGMFKNFNYSLNYFYTWDDVMDMVAKGPKLYTFKPDRLSIFGGSFDYAFSHALFMDDWVIRGEFAYYNGDNFINMETNQIEERDHFDVMWGFDKNFFVDYYVSFQFAQSFLLHRGDDYSGPGLSAIDSIENQYTLMLQKFVYDDRIMLETLICASDEGDAWARPRVSFEYTDEIKLTLGGNFFWGSSDDFYGQWHRSGDQIFFEIKYGF